MITSVIVGISLAQTVTYETRAARIPVILEQLQTITKQKLVADAAFTNEVMVISVTDVNPTDLLTKIARASTGQWEKDKDRLILKPDLKRRAEQEKQRIALRQKQIQDILDRHAKELLVPYTGKTPARLRGGIATAEYYAGMRQTPVSRFAMRLLIAVGAEKLASIERGDRKVFAVNANRMQEPWPKGGDAAIAELRKEWAVRERDPDYRDQFGLPRLGNWSKQNTEWTMTPSSPFEKVWLSVKDILSGNFDNTSVTVGILDKANCGFGGELNSYVPSPLPSPESSPNTAPLTYEEDSQELIEFRSRSNREQISISVNSKLGKQLLNPKFEPLSLCSELYIQLARTRKADLVSLLNDNSFTNNTSQGPKATIGDFERSLRQIAVFEEEQGWLLTTPNRPGDARRSRDDRKQMHRLLVDASDGHLSLDTHCDYIAHKLIGLARGLTHQVAALINPQIPPVSEASARVYAALTTGQRQSQEVPYLALSDAAKKAMAWSTFQNLNLRRKTVSVPNNESQRQLAAAIPIGDSMDPTYVLPDGIPSGAVLKLSSIEPQLALQPSLSNGIGIFIGYELSTLASDLFFKKYPELDESNKVGLSPDRFRPIERSTLLLQLDTGDYSASFALTDERSISDPVPYEKLPDRYKQAVQAELARMEEAKAKGNPPRRLSGPPGVRTNPPPP